MATPGDATGDVSPRPPLIVRLCYAAFGAAPIRTVHKQALTKLLVPFAIS